MNTPTARPENEAVAEMQADRDAALALLDRLHLRERATGSFRSWDETVQAFVRHRLASTPTALPGAEDVALREAIIRIAKTAVQNHGVRAGLRSGEIAMDIAAQVLALIPRASDEVPANPVGEVREAKAIAAAVLQSACETDPADPEHPDTIMITCDDLESIVRMHVECADERAALKSADAASSQEQGA